MHTCRRCGEIIRDGILTIRDGHDDETAALCEDCFDEIDEMDATRPDDPIDYHEHTVLPNETFPQFVRRCFAELAMYLYDEPTSVRDHLMYRLGSECSFARETYMRQTTTRTAQQIVDDFLAGVEFDRTRTWFLKMREAGPPPMTDRDIEREEGFDNE